MTKAQWVFSNALEWLESDIRLAETEGSADWNLQGTMRVNRDVALKRSKELNLTEEQEQRLNNLVARAKIFLRRE